jgi:Skp family chaperone for outer membrane proteins
MEDGSWKMENRPYSTALRSNGLRTKAAALAVGSVLTIALSAVPAFAQTPPPATPPAQNPPATPPAQNPPAAPAAAAKPAPAPFPEGARVAYIFMQGIFNGSVDGKAAAARLQEWEKKKTAEIQAKSKEAEALQAKINQGGSVLNDQARAQAQRDLQRLQREITAMQEDARAEGDQLRQQLLNDFSQKVNPIIAAVAKERGLHMVFSVSDQANVAWADPGLDLTQEIIKRVDATKK